MDLGILGNSTLFLNGCLWVFCGRESLWVFLFFLGFVFVVLVRFLFGFCCIVWSFFLFWSFVVGFFCFFFFVWLGFFVGFLLLFCFFFFLWMLPFVDKGITCAMWICYVMYRLCFELIFVFVIFFIAEMQKLVFGIIPVVCAKFF